MVGSPLHWTHIKVLHGFFLNFPLSYMFCYTFSRHTLRGWTGLVGGLGHRLAVNRQSHMLVATTSIHTFSNLLFELKKNPVILI